MRRGKLLLLVVAILFFTQLIRADAPQLHTIQGFIFQSDNSQVPSGTNVKITTNSTNSTASISTFGPPGNTGFYSTNILATDGELATVTSYNSTNFGRNYVNLLNSPSTTRVNVTLNMSRSPETIINITSPSSGTNFNQYATFNITFNVSAIVANATNCNATISFSNQGIVNTTSANNSTKNIGNISLNSFYSNYFELQVLIGGSVNITITTLCSSDGENFLHSNHGSIIIGATQLPPQLHTIQGFIFQSNNLTQVPSGTNVTITIPSTGTNKTIKTSGPPGNTGFYSTTILAIDGDQVIVYAENTTHEGNTTATILASPSVTRINVSLSSIKPVDVMINSTSISFNLSSLIEGNNISIKANIWNLGKGDLSNVTISFYHGDPNIDGIFIGNYTIPLIPLHNNQTASILYSPTIGQNNIFVLVDPPIETNGSINETNETNNVANNTFFLTAWQDLYGNISLERILASSSNLNLSSWSNETSLIGNVFVTDSESQISWSSLQAIHKNVTDSDTTNDFADIDALLNMTSLDDSLENKFTTDGNSPKQTANFTVHNDLIQNVPIINSTNNTNFVTGILWDTTDDIGDGQFSQEDKEDFVFITKINKQAQGFYGIYDYETTIPVKLREYFTTNVRDVYIYYQIE